MFRKQEWDSDSDLKVIPVSPVKSLNPAGSADSRGPPAR
jgi:hypothetical protein